MAENGIFSCPWYNMLKLFLGDRIKSYFYLVWWLPQKSVNLNHQSKIPKAFENKSLFTSILWCKICKLVVLCYVLLCMCVCVCLLAISKTCFLILKKNDILLKLQASKEALEAEQEAKRLKLDSSDSLTALIKKRNESRIEQAESFLDSLEAKYVKQKASRSKTSKKK